jgi:hypothetical protein
LHFLSFPAKAGDPVNADGPDEITIAGDYWIVHCADDDTVDKDPTGTKKGRSEERPDFSTSVGSLLGEVSHRVLDVAGGVVCGAFGFVELAFGLKLFVAGQFAGGIFDGALGLVGRALNVFAIHLHSPHCQDA